ncbi:MAG: hypothetical protein ACYCPO_07320 [Acidobacteriaceae bacterium]
MNKTLGAPSFVRLLHKGWESATLSPAVNTLTENALNSSVSGRLVRVPHEIYAKEFNPLTGLGIGFVLRHFENWIR